MTNRGQHTGQPNGTRTFIINSRSALAAYGSLASNADTVDFARYTLLGGHLLPPGGIFVGAQGITVDCKGTYTYSVRVGDGNTQSPSSCLFRVLVPKLAGKTKVKFSVTG